MRLIEFRGKRKGGTEWLYGDLNHINGMVYIFPRTEDTPANSPDWFEVDPETVGQYINLKDSKDKKIYVGDFFWDGKNIWVVKYRGQNAQFYLSTTFPSSKQQIGFGKDGYREFSDYGQQQSDDVIIVSEIQIAGDVTMLGSCGNCHSKDVYFDMYWTYCCKECGYEHLELA